MADESDETSIIDFMRASFSRFDAKLDRILGDIGELKTRMLSLETRMTSLDKAVAYVHERLDGMQGQFDRVNGRLDRIEKRLDLQLLRCLKSGSRD